VNDNLQNTLNEILAALAKAAEQAGAVAQEQLPLLVQEYLRWGFVEALVTVLLLAVLFCVAVTLAVRAHRWGGKACGCGQAFKPNGHTNYYCNDPGPCIGVILLGVAAAACCVGLFNHGSTALQIWIAPRVYLLERVSEMVR